MKYEVCTFGNPVLRERTEKVGRVDGAVRQLIRDMIETMRSENGVGLAAPQVGNTQRVCVVDIPASYDMDANGRRMNPDVTMPLALINPALSDSSPETDAVEEGCLSFPDISASIVRPVEITAAYLDEEGREHTRRFRGFLARAIQHECDHLDGVLIVDRMSAVKKIALSGRLKRLKRETRERLAEAV